MKLKDLLKLLGRLSIQEQDRLELHLAPVIKARMAYMNFISINIPEDKQALKDIEAKRRPLLNSEDPDDNAALAELNKQLRAARKNIESHIEKRVALMNKFIKAKETFARGY
jgi:hypothetical protein